jgi:hypothetical protein
MATRQHRTPARLAVMGMATSVRDGAETSRPWADVSLALLHPADVLYGRAADIVAAHQRVLDEALARHAERFVRGRPLQKTPPAAAWINPPPMDQVAITPGDRIEEDTAR